MTERSRRQKRILDHISGGSVQNQEHLQALLSREGIQVAQATLSRDLRELGVAKGPHGYIVPGEDLNGGGEGGLERELERALRSFALSIEHGAATVVVKTGPGRAQYVAFELDRTPPEGAIGTLAGDDTVFVAARSERDATAIVLHLRTLAGLVHVDGVDNSTIMSGEVLS
jgi:transcriptional regulator of arginine metabolism